MAKHAKGATMQHVLVHVDQSLGPIGAWSFNGIGLLHFYPDSLDVAISARARALMASRDLDVSVPDWMDLIADTDPTMLDEFHSFDIRDDASLPAILSEFRRTWSMTD